MPFRMSFLLSLTIQTLTKQQEMLALWQEVETVCKKKHVSLALLHSPT
jgi:hypothetical protein